MKSYTSYARVTIVLYKYELHLVEHNAALYIYNFLCGSVAKASDTQAVGHGFEPRPDH